MTKIILYIATSLDNFIAAEDGSVDWLFHDQDYGYTDFFASVDILLMGRKTFGKMLEFGDMSYTEKETYIFSKNPGHDDKDVKFIDDAVPFLEKIIKDKKKSKA